MFFKNSALFDPRAFSSLQDPRGDTSGVQQGMIMLVLVSWWMRWGAVRREVRQWGVEEHQKPITDLSSPSCSSEQCYKWLWWANKIVQETVIATAILTDAHCRHVSSYLMSRQSLGRCHYCCYLRAEKMRHRGYEVTWQSPTNSNWGSRDVHPGSVISEPTPLPSVHSWIWLFSLNMTGNVAVAWNDRFSPSFCPVGIPLDRDPTRWQGKGQIHSPVFGPHITSAEVQHGAR